MVDTTDGHLTVKTPLTFLFLEPFFGGSHREFARGLVAHSRHQIDLLPLPARFWKLRMRGAALYFIKKKHFFQASKARRTVGQPIVWWLPLCSEQ
jgi:hypothetical protein